MDFEELFKVLPKRSVTWNVADIETWLQFIGLSSYAPQFSNAIPIQFLPQSTVVVYLSSQKTTSVTNSRSPPKSSQKKL
jgi:hypothetical protein